MHVLGYTVRAHQAILHTGTKGIDLIVPDILPIASVVMRKPYHTIPYHTIPYRAGGRAHTQDYCHVSDATVG